MPETSNIPVVPYASAAPRRKLQFSWLACIATTAVLLFFAVVMLGFMPRIEGVYKDFHLDLPLPTRWLLSLSRMFSESNWGMGALLLVPPAIGFIVPIVFPRRPATDIDAYVRLVNRLITVMVVALAILCMIIIGLVLILMPLLTLVEGISSHP